MSPLEFTKQHQLRFISERLADFIRRVKSEYLHHQSKLSVDDSSVGQMVVDAIGTRVSEGSGGRQVVSGEAGQ